MSRLLMTIAWITCLLTSTQLQAGVLTADWDHQSTLGAFGRPGTSTYGQTFVASNTNAVLHDFTFQMGLNLFNAHLQLKGQVYEWQGSLLGNGVGGSIGPALFSTGSLTPTVGIGFTPITINTGALALTPGHAYVMLLTISDPVDFAATSGGISFAASPGHAATAGGGGFVFYNNTNNLAALSNGSTPWNHFQDFGNLAFTANFGSLAEPPPIVPEPSSLVIFSTVGAVLLLRKKGSGLFFFAGSNDGAQGATANI